MTTALDGWGHSEFTADGRTLAVFRRGSGPGVIVIHEIPGITPLVAAFANDVVEAGFTALMPSLVGSPGRALSGPYGAKSMLRVCVAREFTTWALQQTSPIITWLRALAADLHASVGGPGVGAVGMCFSGGFALGMMVDDVMVAPVLSQPSLPFALGKPQRRADLNLSPGDAQRVGERAAAGCEVLGLRFDQDKLVGTRFESLRALLGDAFIAIELPSTSKRDHSVLTEQRDEASVQRVIEFLRAKLSR
ncbi:MAG: dienelactone hydrolase family protein [Actinomycetota bacterium]|nr:dienelactone hydrolase family protein [Actinomycetota bacterium]